jgi:hypothetical protein
MDLCVEGLVYCGGTAREIDNAVGRVDVVHSKAVCAEPRPTRTAVAADAQPPRRDE